MYLFSCRCLKSGVWPFLLVISLCHIILIILDWYVPRKYIDICKDMGTNSKTKLKNYLKK